MRKLKLLLASVALLFGGGISVWAQTDVTSTYLTNADFSGTYTSAYTINTNRYVYQPNGWTVDYVNVSTWNMTVVGSTDAMASNFTDTYAVPADNNKYMVRFRDNKPSEYVDLSQTITVLEKGWYTFSADLIRENGSKINVALYAGETTVSNSNAGKWENSSFTLLLDANTEIKVGIKFTNLAADGVKAGADNVKIMFSAINNGDDVTSLITNADVTSTTGWTNGRTNSNQQYTGAPDNTYMDTWNATLDQKQVVKLPAGYYLLKAATRASEGITGGNIYGYVKEDDITFQTDIHKEGAGGNLLGNGWAWTRVPVTVTQTSDVTIGFWSNCSGSQWAGADNFTLTYYDSELNLKAAQFEQVRSDAAAWKTKLDATISTGAKSLLTAEDGKSYASVADYNAAIARLEAAITFARTTYLTLKARYDAAKNAVKALPEQTEVYTGSASINADEDALDEQVDAATTKEEVDNAILAWRNAAATFLGAVTVKEGQYFNITNIFLDNADFSAGNILGWETNYVSGQQAQNIGYQGANYTNEDVTISQFIEAWKPQPGTLGDGYLRQTVQNLPEGKYTLEADAISVQQKDENLEVAGSYLYIYADGVDYKTALNTLNNKPQHFSREFLFTGEGDVVFGLKTESSTGNWLCADNFVVKFYGIDLSAYVTQLADAVAEAEAVTGIPDGAATVLAGVVTEYNKSYNTSKAYAAAISAIQTATATALSFKTPFANYNTAKETAEAFEEDAMFADAWTALQDAISSYTISNEDLANTSITVETLNTAKDNFVNANNAATAAVAAKTTYTNATELINGGTNVNLTTLITNPSFEDNLTGWTNVGSMVIQNNTSFGKTGSKYAEYWQPNGTKGLSQNIASLPAGIYTLTLDAKARGVTSAKLFANTNEVPMTIGDQQNTYNLTFEIADKAAVNIGFEGVGTGAGSSWFAMDNFTLTYVGTINDLTYTLATGKMGTDKSAAQESAETTFLSEKTLPNYNALLTAIAEAEASKATYESLKTIIDVAEGEKEGTNFVTSAALTTFEEAIAGAKTAWENVTYTEQQASDAIGYIRWCISNYLGSTWITPDPKPEGWWYFNTWSTEGDTDGTNFFNPFFENFVGNTNNLPANTFTAQLTGLENGRYEVEIWARVQRRSDADFNADNSMITMNVNGGSAVSLMSGQETVGSGTSQMRLGRYTAVGNVTDGTLTLTINVKLGANVHWLSWRDVKYTKLGPAITISEDDTAVPTPEAIANVTLTRTLSASYWNTFSVPFDMAIPDGWSVKEFDSATDNVINFKNAESIVAGKPYLVKPTTDVENPFFESVNVKSTEGSTDGEGDYKFAAQIYNKSLATDGTIAYLATDGKIKKLNTASGLKGLRAYFIIPAGAAARINFIDDETTGISRIENSELRIENSVYNLQGQRVNKAQKGLYIKNGKKVIVK